jgi:hypothetical protein
MRARDMSLSLVDSADRLDRSAAGASLVVQSLRNADLFEALKAVAKQRRWLFVADDITPGEEGRAASQIQEVLQRNEGSRLLFVGRFVAPASAFHSTVSFDAEFIVDSLLRPTKTRIQIARFAPSILLLEQIQRDRTAIDDLTWRSFERLVAGLLGMDGYIAELMRGTKDGGVDVVAVKDLGTGGYFKSIWRAKKKGVGRKVGLSTIRKLADSRQEFGASKGIIVTSAYLTHGALERVRRDAFTLGKVDRDDLALWVDRMLKPQTPDKEPRLHGQPHAIAQLQFGTICDPATSILRRVDKRDRRVGTGGPLHDRYVRYGRGGHIQLGP